MTRKLSLLLLLSVPFFPAYSQSAGKLWGGLELGYGLSLQDKGDYYNFSYGHREPMAPGVVPPNMDINILRLLLGYYVTPQLSLGVGIGFNTYNMPPVSVVPLYMDVRYHPIRHNPNIILNIAAGYSLFTSPQPSRGEVKGKFLSDFAIGYKLFTIKKVSFVPFIGYNYINYTITDSYNYVGDPVVDNFNFNQSRHSVFLKIGVYY
jgi:hypothetical protein